MKITQDVRDYARDKGLEEDNALAMGMEDKSKEFLQKGSELYL